MWGILKGSWGVNFYIRTKHGNQTRLMSSCWLRKRNDSRTVATELREDHRPYENEYLIPSPY